MRQIFMNVATLSKEKGDALEQEMSFVFETPEKHTWREGYDVIWTFLFLEKLLLVRYIQ